MTNTKTILGISIAAVFVFAMMTNPVFAAAGIDMKIVSTDGFSITVKGTPGNTVDNENAADEAPRDAYVYAVFTDETRNDGAEFAAWVAATHITFDDDSEQTPDIEALHGHKLWLDSTSLCVKGAAFDDSITAEVDENTVTINTVGETGNIGAWVTAAYGFTDDGLCPTKVFSVVPNA